MASLPSGLPSIRYEADLRDTDNAWLRLHYRANGKAVDYKVQLVTTKPNYGGHRWWFICPIVRRDGGPPRRVAKLYLPSGSKYFVLLTDAVEKVSAKELWN